MIYSMTGFGKTSPEVFAATKWNFEISSVNRKQLEVRINLPREFTALETEIRTFLKGRISRGMVNTMGEIRGVDIWVNFTETDEGVWCELRSSKYNINPVAVKYGGGGHQKASGATVADRAAAMAMLADLDAMIEE